MRLIDADALMRKFKTASPMAIDGRAKQMVEEMPTIERRQKGHWKLDFAHNKMTCSECRHTFDGGFDFDSADNFCRHCGADMRGEQDGHEPKN